MDSASPTATISTNRGGRPKDWTEPRTRRLIRLYLYTSLPLPKILELLEEDDFKPGKDAANKVKNSVLGNDPRWIRPKDEEEEKTRFSGLRNSLRGRRPRPDTTSHDEHGPPHGAFSPGDAPRGETTFAHQYPISSYDYYYTDSASCAYSGTTYADPRSTTIDEGASSRLFRRFNTSRHDTGLTASTDISIASAFKKKLSDFSADKVKRTVKVLKRYTFPKNLEAQNAPDVPSNLPYGYGPRSPVNPTADPYSAAHAVPGDFLNAELFDRQPRCAGTATTPAHAAGICWCKVADQIHHTTTTWAMLPLMENLATKDEFDNTMFHHMAAKEGGEERFLHLIHLALQEPRLPLHGVNTAGQTFLHVLHHSWFQAGSRLDDLLETLQTNNFDILARDVYGRSFFHMLPANMRTPARFPGQGSNFFYLANRRDAFGVKPMDMGSSPGANRHPSQDQTRHMARGMMPETSTEQTPRVNTQVGIVPFDDEIRDHANMLWIIRTASQVDDGTHMRGPEEDAYGRNAFHCLAEVSFDISQAATKHNSRMPPTDGSRLGIPVHSKRKHLDEEIEKPQTTSDSPRLFNLKVLIDAKVDANHYDKAGHTPLMSFVLHSSDNTKCDKDESEKIITLFKKAGAKLEARNRNGETALHLAAKHGKTIALRTLLDLGANPNTRNAQGSSILEVIDGLFMTSERDDKNNARFEAARAILTRTTKDAVQNPTVIDEWARAKKE